ncbi:CP12 domain-containing protein [Haematococcus lacustris]
MALSLRASSSATVRATSRVAVKATRPVVRSVRVFADQAKSPVETAIQEAEEACKDGSTKDCAAAWDTVEEVSAAISHKKAAEKALDPLEQYCEGAPDADECRVYED